MEGSSPFGIVILFQGGKIKMTFADFFQAATGNTPFPWQYRLYEKFVAGNYPTAVSIPTGLGKTSVVAIWLIALALHPEKTPRRLVYVVNRRTVVDQTTDEVEKIRQALLDSTGALKEISDRLHALCALPLPSSKAAPLAISTLRGQHADNREWSADPTRPAVIIGTVDMIGSGLLFSRYTVGFKLRPHHAAFLGQDVLLIHDEAHLEPAFQTLLDSIVAEQTRSNDLRKLRVMELTATIRSDAVSQPLKISEEDIKNELVNQRISATKTLLLRALDEKKKEFEVITKLAIAQKESARAILIFVRSVEDAIKIANKLEKDAGKNKVCTLTGTMRGKERDELVKQPIFQRFLTKNKQAGIAEDTVFLVATSAGEVGINISADDLICDLSTYDSMAQRFGRVNRFGEHGNSTITVVHPTLLGKRNRQGELVQSTMDVARQRTLTLLQQLGRNASPAALERLPAADRIAAFSPSPQMRVASSIQFDAWALTSIRHPIEARPPVAPYLHGEAEWQPPETRIVWREELDIVRDEFLAVYPPEELLEDFPIKPHELLRDTTDRIIATLGKIVARRQANSSALPDAWVFNEFGGVQILSLTKLTYANTAPKNLSKTEASDLSELMRLLTNATLILPASLGGISASGLLSGDADAAKVDVSEIENSRLRIYTSSPEIPPEYAVNFRVLRVIDTSYAQDKDEDSPTRYWLWLERKKTINGEKRTAVLPETLATHSKAVVDNIVAISAKLFPVAPVADAPNFCACLPVAGTEHDQGKDRPLWQQNIGNISYDSNKPETILAKPGASMCSRNIAKYYRHEFGSVSTISAGTAGGQIAALLAPFSEIERDIILHLIAAHHGRGRPHFPAEEILDYGAAPEESMALASKIPLRFARLQQSFGRWGLAWLESILRSADYAASAGIVAEPAKTAAAPPTAPQNNTDIQKTSSTSIELKVDVTNPGHFFACCGLVELTACLVPNVFSHFEQGDNKEWRFVMTATSVRKSNQEFTLPAILKAFAAAELTVADAQLPAGESVNDEINTDDATNTGSRTADRNAPLYLGSPFNLRLDWWKTSTQKTGPLKVWAGSMDCLRIARAMKDAVGEIIQRDDASGRQNILFNSRVVYGNKEGKPQKVEPFYFDAKRGPNADARDVGFSPNSLKFETVAAPAVEILCLIGLQRATPIPADEPRQFIYHLWTKPLPSTILAAALNGLLPGSTQFSYRFESWFRTSQRKHKAFLSAQPIGRS